MKLMSKIEIQFCRHFFFMNDRGLPMHDHGAGTLHEYIGWSQQRRLRGPQQPTGRRRRGDLSRSRPRSTNHQCPQLRVSIIIIASVSKHGISLWWSDLKIHLIFFLLNTKILQIWLKMKSILLKKWQNCLVFAIQSWIWAH